MDKFNKELKEAKNPWIKRIGEYLLSRDDIQENLKKEKKSLNECFEYILGELAKKAEKNKENGVGFVSGEDHELFELAVHYYDEDNLKVNKMRYETNANGTATEKQLQEYMINYSNKSKKEEKVQKVKVKNQNEAEIEAKINDAVEKALDSYKKEQAEIEAKKKARAKAKKEANARARQNSDQLDIFEILGDNG